jgi:hypothetical protein
VAVLTINSRDGTPNQVQMWMEARGYEFPVLWDDGYVRRAGVRGFPTTWVVDQEGRIAFEWVGGDANRFAQELTWRVEAVLGG